MRLIDTHVHLDSKRFDPDRGGVIQRALEAGIQMITVGTDIASSESAVEIAQKYGIYAAVGIHPHEARRFVRGGSLEPEALARLEELLREERVVAAGEIGLDYFKNFSPKEAQLVTFREQLALAERFKKPVVIHNREAEGDLIEILRGFDVEGVLHSFTGDGALALRIMQLGLYLSISGIVTFAKGGGLREAVRIIPQDRLLLETDAPFLAPVPLRGRRNEPMYVRHVAEAVAQLRGLTLSDLSEATTKNARRLFRIEL